MNDHLYTYKDAVAEFKMFCDGDLWGTAMEWWFTVADEIYWNRDFEVPESWRFKPSPIGPANDPDNYETEVVRGMTDNDLLKFGNLINRYCRLLRNHGLDY